MKVASGGSYEQGGLVLYKDDKNFVKAHADGHGGQRLPVIEFGQDINGVTTYADRP